MATTTQAAKFDSGWTLSKIWTKLIEPSPLITDSLERRQVRLLSSILTAYVALGFVVIFGYPLLVPDASLSVVSIIPSLANFIPYGLSRTRHYKVSLVFLFAITVLGILYPALESTGNNRGGSFIYMILPLLLATILLAKRAAVSFMILLTLFMLGIQFVLPGIPNLAGAITLMGIVTILLIVFLNHRDALERDRQAELRHALQATEVANHAMTQAYTELERKNTELAQANALIKESTRLKSEFLATMSHELRTPLNAIRGFTSIMIEGMGGDIDDEARHMVERVSANGERLLTLINDILDIAKIEAGRMELVDEVLSPMQLTQQWRAQMSVLAEQRGLDFEIVVDPSLPEILHGDSTRLTQVATNLLSNAFKFTKEGQVRLDVKRGAGSTWQLVVSDTGIGIPPHALNYIFEEFRQVDGSSMRAYGGSGLGLAIVRNICRMMDGRIEVASELGKGSTFTVTLPLVTNAEMQLALE